MPSKLPRALVLLNHRCPGNCPSAPCFGLLRRWCPGRRGADATLPEMDDAEPVDTFAREVAPGGVAPDFLQKLVVCR